MDISSPEMWKQEWTAFWSAPYIILPFIGAGWLTAWWFRGRTSEGEIAAMKAEISSRNAEIAVVEQRLKLAADALAASKDSLAASDRAKDELDNQFLAYKEKVASEGSRASPAKVDAAIVKVASGNTDVRSSLSAAIRDLEFAQYGALRKLDPETLKKLQDVGKPFINADGTRKF